MRLSLLLLVALLVGCDSGGPADTLQIVRVSGLEISAVRAADVGDTVQYSSTDALQGIFRFAVGAQLGLVVRGTCAPTSSGECLPRVELQGYPTASTLTLDTDIVADGETVPAGRDLILLLSGEFQSRVNGEYLGGRVADQVFGAAPPLRPASNVFFDPARVRVPDGERTLTLRWTMPSGDTFEASTTFDYAV